MEDLSNECKKHRTAIYSRELYPDTKTVSNQDYENALNHKDSCKNCGLHYEGVQRKRRKLAPNTAQISISNLEKRMKEKIRTSK